MIQVYHIEAHLIHSYHTFCIFCMFCVFIRTTTILTATNSHDLFATFIYDPWTEQLDACSKFTFITAQIYNTNIRFQREFRDAISSTGYGRTYTCRTLHALPSPSLSVSFLILSSPSNLNAHQIRCVSKRISCHFHYWQQDIQLFWYWCATLALLPGRRSRIELQIVYVSHYTL